MSKEIRILDHLVKPGDSVHLKMDIARLNTRSKIEVPIIVERAKKDGPCLLLMGGIHGDEINGIEIVRQIVAQKINKPDSGTVICIPLLNVFGFLNQMRAFPDGRDLNRVFPGSAKGSLASRFAFHVMKEVIPNVDYCIDYHTGGAQRFNYAHIRVDNSDQESLKLAKAFGTRFIVLAKNREKSFRDSMVKLGKKVLLFEGGKSLYLDKTVTKIGAQGAINIMHALGMRDFSADINLRRRPIIIESSTWIRARHSGMYRSTVQAGQKVEKGAILGSISDPFGGFEKSFKNQKAGYILNCNQSPIVNQGDALVHIGFKTI
ncbi:MAG: succinylglutamate desuccinylase/aspartoacylase family protein [Saprospiraceae bacterium]|nr:succinylglutamate desuccinylase/aspartoacylase family protein [Saprospiraceae bacterium]